MGFNYISVISASTFVPVVVLLIWYKNEIEDNELVRERIESVKKFYKYTEILEEE